MQFRVSYQVALFLLAVGGAAVLETTAAPEGRVPSVVEKARSFVHQLEELIERQDDQVEEKAVDPFEKKDQLTEELGDDTWLPEARAAGCPTGYKMYNGICYKAFDTAKNFVDASKTCVADGGTLAMPKDAATNAFLLSLKNAVDQSGFFWIGLVDQHQEGGWEWIDGTSFGSYSAWAPEEPNNHGDEDCAEYFPTEWNDAKCSESNRKFICQMIPAGCPDGYVYHRPSRLCYKAYNDEKNYNDAAATCSADGGTLAMPRDTVTNKFLIYLKNLVDSNAWFRIGLTDHHQEGGWVWEDDVALGDFGPWGPDEPNNQDNEDCGEYFPGGHDKRNTWNDGECTEGNKKFICQVVPTGCPGGYQQHGGNCYKAVNNKRSYDDAAAACRAEDGYLAMPADEATNTFLATLKNKVDKDAGFWLGFNDKSVEGGWRNIHGDRLGSFQAWAPGEPNQYGGNEDCAEMNKNDQWNDLGCSSEQKFICQIPLQVINSCGGNLPGSSGVFVSPGYPQTSIDNEQCRWFLIVPHGRAVHLDFQDFDLVGDSVTVLDGCSNAELGTFTGSSLPPGLISSGRTMEVVFTRNFADSAVQQRGFRAHYYPVEAPKSSGDARRGIPEDMQAMLMEIIKQNDMEG